jgi:hypothetical protein
MMNLPIQWYLAQGKENLEIQIALMKKILKRGAIKLK